MDSSSIVKLYVDEANAYEVRRLVTTADQIATSALAYVEVHSALRRARADRKILSNSAYTRILGEFHGDWAHYLVVSTDERIILEAGEIATKHPLSGADSVHLASVMALREVYPDEVSLSTWDKRLSASAASKGLSLAHEVTS